MNNNSSNNPWRPPADQAQQQQLNQNSRGIPHQLANGTVSRPMAAAPAAPQQRSASSLMNSSQTQPQRQNVPGYGMPQGSRLSPVPPGGNQNGAPAPWGVPNPLMSAGQPAQQGYNFSQQSAPAPMAHHSTQRQHQQQNFRPPMTQPQSQSLQHHHHDRASQVRPQTMAAPGNHGQSLTAAQQQQLHQQQQMARQQQQQQVHQQQQMARQQQQQMAPQQVAQARTTTSSGGKTKVTLTQVAKQALAKAIWSAIRSPNGEVAPALMEEAIKTGLPRHAILNAAKVAKEREAMKRRAKQAQGATNNSQAGVQQMQAHNAVSHAQRMPQAPQVASNHPHYHGGNQSHQPMQVRQPAQHQQMHHQQKMQQQQRNIPLVTQAPATSMHPSSHYPQQNHQHRVSTPKAVSSTLQKTVPASKPSGMDASRLAAQKKAQQMALAAQNAERAKYEERMKWKRVQNGVFMVQKERFVSLPYSVGAMVRNSQCDPAVKPTQKKTRSVFKEALALQKQLKSAALRDSGRESPKLGALLLDPERFRRIKVEPKKHIRALDRNARKARQTVAEGLNKQLKELHKQIASHQTEFNKFHRGRKMELAKVCKAVRDSFDKEEKQKEKEAAQAEKARMAALKANDMTAYSKLLEDTRNDRLKYLLEKTEKQFNKISSLLQNRSSDGNESTAPASGGASSYYATAHMKTEEVRQPSILVGGDLKEYQLMGLQWMISLYNNKLNGILADEMGLGKTIQAISLVAYLMEFKQNLGPFLIIVPLSTLSNWQNEFAKWCPAARVVCYKGLPTQRRDIYKDEVRTGQFNVLLTTYEYIIRDKKYLRKTEWQYAIVDEGHRMKNAESKFAVTLGTQYTTKHRILLTGTPLMNDLSELWSLLNFLLPTVFNSVESFDEWFSRPFSQFGESKGEETGEELISNEERILIIHRLHELLRPFMLRRVKSEVLDQLPEKVEKVLRCDLSSWQRELYKQISRKAAADVSIVSEQAPTRGLNNIVMQLRKVCNHPYLFTPEGYHINDTIVRSSGKLALLDQMLPKLKLAGHRVLLFTQMTAVMTILEDYFALRGFLSLRLDGSTPAEEREKRMYKFNSPDSPYFIFLLSTRAGGLGLNLTAADTVIIFDSDWNPMMDLQAQDRAHRIGQRSSNVSVFRLVTNSPVEEKILSRATEKLNVSELVVESGKFNKDSVETDNSLERKRMMEVLLTDFDGAQSTKAPSEKVGSDDGDEDDGVGSDGEEKEDLNELLSNNETDYQLYAQFDKERARNGLANAELYVEHSDVPDWILNPVPAGSATGNFQVQDMGDSSRKRKAVVYDDGLTEKQFLRIMEKKAREEESAKQKGKKRARVGGAKGEPMEEDDGQPEDLPADGALLTDWTFRKLITCSKAVAALKDHATKRKLCEIFMEKPDPATFPDYYELIEKPIAINDILRKVRAKIYVNLQEYKADWQLMFANARKFNGEDSWVVEDAKAIEKELERVLKKNGFSDDFIPAGKGQKKNKSPAKPKLRIKLSLKKDKK